MLNNAIVNIESLKRGLNPKSVFQNNTTPLFLLDPKNLADKELPVVREHSGLSRNQRRKYKLWAYDPRLTRIRMEAAQSILKNKLVESDIADKTSILDSIMEDMKGPVPSSQTHFKVDLPYDYEKQQKDAAAALEKLTQKLNKGGDEDEKDAKKKDKNIEQYREFKELEGIKKSVAADDLKEWGLEEDDTEDVDEVFNEIMSEPSYKSELIVPYPTRGRSEEGRSRGRADRGKYSQYQNIQREPRGSYQQYVPKSTKSKAMKDDHSDEFNKLGKEDMLKIAREKFDRANIGFTMDHSDHLLYMQNQYGFMIKPMIETYVQGIAKERQISITRKQENMIEQLSNVMLGMGKQLDSLKSVVQIQGELTSTLYGSVQLFNESNSSTKSLQEDLTELSVNANLTPSRTVKFVELEPSIKSNTYNTVQTVKAPSLKEKGKDKVGESSRNRKKGYDSMIEYIYVVLDHLGASDVMKSDQIIESLSEIITPDLCEKYLSLTNKVDKDSALRRLVEISLEMVDSD
ncbi:phosphoprotein [Yerba mate virus A]|uniref:Phosphoprotein n=1 Tax=Yerba mate virus A TaxID=2713499 RepID=A0A6G6CID9_9RHAB|nr:phosphoprotein [Yerba mate virus A]QID92306.1 phosphoprotein [Yerba mate virus A]